MIEVLRDYCSQNKDNAFLHWDNGSYRLPVMLQQTQQPDSM